MGSDRRSGLVLGAAAALAITLASCSTGAGSAADWSAAGSAPPVGTAGETAMADFVLTSPSFDESGAMPVRHSCDGTDVSPALAWQGAPQGTVSFALIVDDPDARGFIHWVVFDIPGRSEERRVGKECRSRWSR